MKHDFTYENCIILLMGFAGVGKLTTAKELATYPNFKLVDNHTWINPVFGLINQDGVTQIPKATWKKVDKICDVVFETMCELSPNDFSFVITQGLIEGDDESKKFYRRIRGLVESRKCLFLPVRLECAEEAIVKRIQSAERRDKYKAIDPEWAAQLSRNNEVFQSGHPFEITIDNTDKSPGQVAKIIIDQLNKIKEAASCK
jgi:shikimate kinase